MTIKAFLVTTLPISLLAIAPVATATDRTPDKFDQEYCLGVVKTGMEGGHGFETFVRCTSWVDAYRVATVRAFADGYLAGHEQGFADGVKAMTPAESSDGNDGGSGGGTAIDGSSILPVYNAPPPRGPGTSGMVSPDLLKDLYAMQQQFDIRAFPSGDAPYRLSDQTVIGSRPDTDLLQAPGIRDLLEQNSVSTSVGPDGLFVVQPPREGSAVLIFPSEDNADPQVFELAAEDMQALDQRLSDTRNGTESGPR